MINRIHGKHWMPPEVVDQVQAQADFERLASEIVKLAEATSVRKTAIRWGVILLAWVAWLVFNYITRS